MSRALLDFYLPRDAEYHYTEDSANAEDLANAKDSAYADAEYFADAESLATEEAYTLIPKW